jgi:hypothetical protein
MTRINKEYLEKSFRIKMKELKKMVERHMKNEKCLIVMSSFMPNGNIALTQYCSELKKEDIFLMLSNSMEELNKTKKLN